MKIAITGAQGTGKSTLLNELSKLDVLKDYKFINEITRTLKSRGFKINEQGDDRTQLEIMRLHKDYSYLNNTIYDRCVLDGLVYTYYLYLNNQVSDSTIKKAINIFEQTINKYDKIFLLEPEFDLVDDGVRSINKCFRNDIVDLFNKFINDYNINIIKLSGSVENRVNQFLSNIKEIK